MNPKYVTNRTVFEDWSGDERRAALARIRPMRVRPAVGTIAGVKPSEIWMNDVSGSDRRSVKAWLAGRGDSRVMLWRVKSFLGLVRIADIDALEPAAPRAKSAFRVASLFSLFKWLKGLVGASESGGSVTA